MSADLEQLGESIAELAAHLDAATHRLLVALREFDERGGWHRQGALSCAHWLAWRVGWDLVTARERVRVARKIVEFPAISDALRRGEVSYSKVRALLRIATPANEALILEHARLTTAAQLEKLSRKYARVQRHDQEHHPQNDELRRYVRRRETDDGMIKIEAVLHPEEAELVWSMLDHAAKQLARHSQNAPPSDPMSTSNLEDARATHRGVTGGDSAESPRSADVEPFCDSTESPLSSDDHAVPRMPSNVELLVDSATSRVPSDVKLHGDCAVPRTPSDVELCVDSAASRASSDVELYGDCAVPRSPSDEELFVDAAASRVPFDRELGGDSAASRATLDASSGSDSAASSAMPPGAERILHQRVGATKRGFNRADALLSIAQAYLRGDRVERAPVDVVLTIPASNLRNDAADTDVVDVGVIGDSCVSAETARRLSCDAGVIEVIEDEHGVPLSVGRKRRTIAGSLKRALLKRDETCAFPGCTHRTFLEGHHIIHWADGGETNLDNAALLCTHHHRYVHEYGYVIDLGDDRRPRFRDRSGRLVSATPAHHSAPDLGWPGIFAATQGLAIDASTLACDWDGQPAPYARMIDTLVSADGLT